MFAISLIKHFEDLQALGLVRSKRDYARLWLGRGPTYLRDYEYRDRAWSRVAPVTSARLRAHLVAVASQVPVGVSGDIWAVVQAIDRDEQVAATMAGWQR